VEEGTEDVKGCLGLNLLCSPTDPRVDLVFVHGLGGGSRKTWSKTSSISHYWPQRWLSSDPAFQHVRIHSYGYNSDWAKGKDNCLNLHHFGKSLLGELITAPHLGNANTPIVLIGHSMGGLVIKKMYLLSRKDDSVSSFARRLHSIYFLATPHRGSDSAKLLKNILHMASTNRAYIDDLDRNSGAIQSLNDEFRNFSGQVKLWSFYETQKLNVGMTSRLIVDPDSAILGYKEEIQIPMNADHRSICKFDSPTDPNYIIIRNALASTVDDILKDEAAMKPNTLDKIAELKKFLNVSSTYEQDLMTVQDARGSGTCKWFAAKQSYGDWRDSKSSQGNLLWITGKPAAGKSVLSGFIIDDLQQRGLACSYFFFRHGNKSQTRLGTALRHLAFQMAQNDPITLDRISTLQERHGNLNDENDASLWRTLFINCIFQVQFTTHFWVIDALDECVDFAPFLESMIPKMHPKTPLKIIATSRDTPDLSKSFLSLGDQYLVTQSISPTDTLGDINSLVEQKSRYFSAESDDHRKSLVQRIVDKAQGSFLWTVLVLSEMSNAYSKEEIESILQEVPQEMEDLYYRSLQSMSRLPRGKQLAKAILKWVVCSMRPLRLEELDGAIRTQLREDITRLDDSIRALCGQLVTVDRSGRVQMIHETARDFLLAGEVESEFCVRKTDAHTQLARACLTYLTSDEMKPPRTARRRSNIHYTGVKSEFRSYACMSFSHHLVRAAPLADDVLRLVDKFLQCNVLSWIEFVSRTGNLSPLVCAAKHLEKYARALATERSPLGKEIQRIQAWATDLVRLSAKFATALIDVPPAIFNLIPPLCPSGSEILKASNANRNLNVTGLYSSQWDDRLSCVAFREGQPSALCYGHDFFAVGLTAGSVEIYHADTSQAYKTLDHAEPVRFLGIKHRPRSLLASCGTKTVKVWDIETGNTLHVFAAPQRPIALEFHEDVLLVATSKGYLRAWDLGNQAPNFTDRPWSDEDDSVSLRGQPSAISISIPHKMLAVAYNGKPVILWDLDADSYYGSTGKKLTSGESSTHPVTALVFNPNQDIEILAVSYLDGDLVIMDPFDNHELVKIRAQCPTIAASPNGRFLAGAPGGGVLHIYEFDTLKLLYRVQADNFYIKQISFSQDSLRLVDIRGSQCHVWEPTALWSATLGDDSSEDSSRSVVSVVVSNARAKVTAISVLPACSVAFVGKSDGSVSLYDLKTGSSVRELHKHKSPVRILEWSVNGSILASVDISNSIITHKLRKCPRDGLVPERELIRFQLNCGDSIHQALLCERDERLILSTRGSDHLWSSEGTHICTHQEKCGRHSRRWLQHPQNPALVVRFDAKEVQICLWDNLRTIYCFSTTLPELSLWQWECMMQYTRYCVVQMLEGVNFDLPVDGTHNIVPENHAQRDGCDGSGDHGMSGKTARVAFNGADRAFTCREHQISNMTKISTHVLAVTSSKKLIFIDKKSWVCSVDLGNADTCNRLTTYSRHFFVPFEWVAGSRHVICATSSNGNEIFLARNEDVVVIKNGLDHVYQVEVGCVGLKREPKVANRLTVPVL
jgi:WD40 repeat protein/pimeloyl-ACP methyl ester carboxylesterase